MTDSESKPRMHMGVPFTFVLGALFGYGIIAMKWPLIGMAHPSQAHKLFVAFSLGLAVAYLVMQWLDIFLQSLALAKNPIPDTLNVADREAVKDHLAKLQGRSMPVARARHLLQAWSLGWNPRQIIELAGLQSQKLNRAFNAGIVLVLILMFTAVQLTTNVRLVCSVLGLLAVTVLVRQGLFTCVDSYLESRLLVRLPANIPQTAVTAAELAGHLGKSINEAFKNHVPQPEKTAAAMKDAVQGIVANAAKEVEKLQKALTDSQRALVGEWQKAAEATTTDLKDTEKALSTVVTDLTGGMASNAEKLKTMFSTHTHDMDKALGSVSAHIKTSIDSSSEKLKSSLGDYAQHLDKAIAEMANQIKNAQAAGLDKLQSALNQHAGAITQNTTTVASQVKSGLSEYTEKLQAASAALAGQLAKIQALEQQIDKVLHVQQVVEGTLKSVTATEEFKNTLEALRVHIQESDKLMAEISKPKMIRLVETADEG